MHDEIENPGPAPTGRHDLIRSVALRLIGRQAVAPPSRHLATIAGVVGRFSSELPVPEETYRLGAVRSRDYQLVVGPAGGTAPNSFRVVFDSRFATDISGLDRDSSRSGTVDRQRNYEPFRQPGTNALLYEIEFDDEEVERYIETFA